MHERLPFSPAGAEPSSARREGPAAPKLFIAASIAITLVLAGASTVGGASVVHAQVAGSSVSAETESVPFYVVQSSVNGQQEFLFEIAQRYLADGNRFNEIFELNRGRTQPDGSAMTTPTSLLPGWILQLPADAKGAEVQFGPLPGSSPAPPQAQPGPEPTGSPAATPRPSPTATPTNRPTTASPVAPAPEAASETTASDPNGTPVLLWIIVAVLLAGAGVAGVILWLRKRKGSAAAPHAGIPLADRSASWTIDSALKVLVSACDAQQIRFPGLYLVSVDDVSIHVLLSTPSATVPTGWTASSDGRTWSASLAYLQRQRVSDVSNEEYSHLATLGTTEAARVLLNFQHANGPISVEGSSSAVTDVVEGWLSEFVSNPWSGSPRVVRLGGHESAGQETLEQFLARIDGADQGVAVLDSAPNRSQGEALRALYSSPDFGWIFIVKGAYAGASWKFTARDGVLTSGMVPDVRYVTTSGNRQAKAAAAN